MRQRIFILLLLTLATLAAVHHSPAQKKFEPTPLEEKVLRLTNEERVKEKLPPLQLDATLSQVARGHSTNMAKQGTMKHDLDGKTPFDRIRGSGYKYHFAGENIAAGDVPIEIIMGAWMKSEGHRKNILGEKFTHIGIGAVPDATGTVYFTQVFAKPQP